MNLIANPISPRNSNALKVLVLVRENPLLGIFSESPSYVLEKLELVYYGEQRVASCNTHPGNADPEKSLNAARERIADGEFDLVLLGNLRNISKWLDEVAAFIRHCVDHGTRLISFDEHFDTADPNWEDALFDFS